MTTWHWLAVVAWWIVGMAGFVWGWTYRHDFTTRHLLTAFLSGLLGPFAWLMAYLQLVREPWDARILRRRR